MQIDVIPVECPCDRDPGSLEEGLTERGRVNRAPGSWCAGDHRGASSEIQNRGVQESTKGREQREEAC